MSFLPFPPEINSLLMFSGAGSAPMLEAASAWDGLVTELGSAAESFGSVTSGLVGQALAGRGIPGDGRRGGAVFGMAEHGGDPATSASATSGAMTSGSGLRATTRSASAP